MAVFSGFRPFLTKGSTLNGVQNTFFADSVNGVHYIPDATDTYGETTLTTVSAGISAVLDEKNGIPTFGPNLVVNGDFSNGTTGWSAYTATMSVVDGRLRVVALDNDTRFVGQSVTTIIGKSYELSFDYDCGTATNIFFATGPALGSNNFLPYTVVTGSGTIKRVFMVTSTTTWLALGTWVNNSGKEFFYDNVSIRECSGNPSIQTSASLRPLFGRAPVSRRNLFTWSESFDNAVWTKSGLTVAKDAAGSDGTSNTAWTVASTSTSGQIRSTTSGAMLSTTHTYSLVAKAGTANWLLLQGVFWTTPANGGAFFNLTDGTVGTVNTGYTAAIVAVGNGFYRCSISFTTGASDNVGDLWAYIVSSNGATTTSVGQTLIVQQAQFETGSVTTVYQKVVAATDITELGVTSYPFIRMDLSDDVITTSNLGSTKNLLRYTEEFDNAAWFKQYSNTVVPDAATAPDGTLSADKLIERAATQTQRFYQQITAPSTPTVFSVYMKQAERTWALLEYTNGAFAFFNLATGETGAVGGTGITANISSATNGFYRCEIRSSTQTICECRISVTTGNSVFSYLGDGTSGIFLWGAQFEVGSVATAYEYGGLKGTVMVAGRNGTAIENISLPNGVFSLGPTTYTSGTPGILRAVGDIVGYTVTGRTTTSVEQDLLINFYKFRGAKGRLITGPEIWPGTAPVSYVYTGTARTTWDAPTSTFTVNTTGTGQARAKFTLGMVSGKYYFCSYSFVGTIGQFATDPTIGGVAAITNNSVVLARDNGVWFIDAGGLTQGGTLVISSLSIKEIRPE